MPLTRHFLGWNAPLAGKVCDYLLPGQPNGLVDFASTLIVVPTRQAGRRLREAMAARCDAQACPLSLRAVPPSFFVNPDLYEESEAPGSVVTLAWVETLLAADAAAFEGLLNHVPERRDFGWAVQTAELLQGVRSDLCDGAFDVGAAVQRLGGELPEPDRWAAMARLEALYLGRIHTHGLLDPCEARIRRSANPRLPDAIERIVVAAVPDPSLLTIGALHRLSEDLPIEILVHAPEDLDACFDEWGRPDPDAWRERRIPVDNPARDLLVGATPAGQSKLAVALIPPLAAEDAAGTVSIGVPDPEVTPFLLHDLGERGIGAFDPSERPVARHPLCHLLALYGNVVLDGSYASVAAMLRHAHVLAYLESGLGLVAAGVLRDLDEFQNVHLPQRLADMARVLGADTCARRWPSLASAVKWLAAVVSDFVRAPSAGAALRDVLQSVYGDVHLGDSESDRVFRTVAGLVDGVLHEFDDDVPGVAGVERSDVLRLVLQRLSGARYRPERGVGGLDLEGWLELPWSDAPLLVVTGMNDGRVPDGRLSDVFLPDSLRSALGLRDDELRLARDAYLMTVLVESRRLSGRTCFVSGKTSTAGDPLKPSRLLLRCEDDELVARAAQLFRPVAAGRDSCASTLTFRLNVAPPDGRAAGRLERRRLSVTQFRAYLACPFRFYLSHVLEMESLCDDKTGPDMLDFGSMVHAALEEMAMSGMWRCDDEANLAAFLAAQAESWARERFGNRPSLGVTVALDAARQRLAAAAGEQVKLAREGWDILAAEQKIEMDVAGFLIRGTIDRVDRHRDTGRLRVMDYKTSDAAKSPAEAHLGSRAGDAREFAHVTVDKREKKWIDLQLPLYRLLLATAERHDAEPELAYFNLPKASSQTGVAVWDTFDDDLYDSARACASEVCLRVAAAEFWPPSERVPYEDYESILLDDAIRTVDAEAMAAGIKRVRE